VRRSKVVTGRIISQNSFLFAILSFIFADRKRRMPSVIIEPFHRFYLIFVILKKFFPAVQFYFILHRCIFEFRLDRFFDTCYLEWSGSLHDTYITITVIVLDIFALNVHLLILASLSVMREMLRCLTLHILSRFLLRSNVLYECETFFMLNVTLQLNRYTFSQSSQLDHCHSQLPMSIIILYRPV
jgi:hypothetical protein